MSLLHGVLQALLVLVLIFICTLAQRRRTPHRTLFQRVRWWALLVLLFWIVLLSYDFIRAL
jgi:hypothetical protein